MQNRSKAIQKTKQSKQVEQEKSRAQIVQEIRQQQQRRQQVIEQLPVQEEIIEQFQIPMEAEGQIGGDQGLIGQRLMDDIREGPGVIEGVVDEYGQRAILGDVQRRGIYRVYPPDFQISRIVGADDMRKYRIGATDYRVGRSVRDKTLKGIAMDSEQGQNVVSLLGSKGFAQTIVSIINAGGFGVRTDQNGLIYTAQGHPIDSKIARKGLRTIANYNKPLTLTHYRAKAAIRYAQQYNRVIRSLNSQLKSRRMTDDDFNLILQQRAKRENTPANVKNARKILAFIKKYPGETMAQKLEARQERIANFQANLQKKIEDNTNLIRRSFAQ